jgi:hypothetical protein
MNPTDQNPTSNTAFEVLGALWLKDTLCRIERKVDLIGRNTQIDFSKEDVAVRETAQSVADAISHIPHPDKPTK